MAGAYARMKRAGGAPVDPNATGDEFGQDDILAMAQKRLQQNLPASIGLSKGDTVSTSEAGPASTADIMRLLDIAGIKNDGSKIDLKPYMSKRQPDLESLKQFATTRPTEVSLRGLDQIANALSSTDRKVKFEGPGHTADKSLADWTALGDAIQGERDNDFKKQQDLFKAISGITSQKGSSSSRTSDSVNYSVPTPPRGKETGPDNKLLAELSNKLAGTGVAAPARVLENFKRVAQQLGDLSPTNNKAIEGVGGYGKGVYEQHMPNILGANPNKEKANANVVAIMGVAEPMIHELYGAAQPVGEAKKGELLTALGPTGSPSAVRKFLNGLSQDYAAKIASTKAGYPTVRDLYNSQPGAIREEEFTRIANMSNNDDAQSKARALLEARKKAKK